MKMRLKQDVPRYARLTKGIIVDAEPVANHPELMRVKGFVLPRTGRWCGVGNCICQRKKSRRF
jgi:hypothetical protein